MGGRLLLPKRVMKPVGLVRAVNGPSVPGVKIEAEGRAYSWLLLLHPLPHLFFPKQPTRISWATAEKTSLVRSGSGEFFFLFTDVKVLSDAAQKVRLHPSLLLQPLDLFLVDDK